MKKTTHSKLRGILFFQVRFKILFLAYYLTQSFCNAAPVEITFAVPDSGRISLGVFDRTGKLVRILHRLATEENFQVGLNGYTTRWDGLDDAGRPLPEGQYDIRGYLIGDITVSGESFHFNDWVTSEESPIFEKILDFQLLENGDVLLLGQGSLTRLLSRYSSEHGVMWHRTLGGSLALGSMHHFMHSLLPTALELKSSLDFRLAANRTLAITYYNGSCLAFSLETGVPLLTRFVEANDVSSAISANDTHLFIAAGQKITTIPLLRWEPESTLEFPLSFIAMDANNTAILGASRDGTWIKKDDGSSFEQISLPLKITSLSFGMGNTFWFIGSEKDPAYLIAGQASFSGEILRVLRSEPNAPQPEKICAARASDKFAILESRLGLQRLRIMKYGMLNEGSLGWSIAWERTIEECRNFGFVEGRLVANAGNSQQSKELKVRLKENPLTNRQDTLTLRGIFDKKGVRLVTGDGLPITDISTRGDITRIVIRRGESPDQMQLLQGNGTVVEEFLIKGLKNILPLDAGKINLK